MIDFVFLNSGLRKNLKKRNWWGAALLDPTCFRIEDPSRNRLAIDIFRKATLRYFRALLTSVKYKVDNNSKKLMNVITPIITLIAYTCATFEINIILKKMT